MNPDAFINKTKNTKIFKLKIRSMQPKNRLGIGKAYIFHLYSTVYTAL